LGFSNNNNWSITGGELTVDTVLASWLKSRAHYGYLWAEDAETNGKVECVPNHVAGATFTLFPASQQSLYLVVRYKSQIVSSDLKATPDSPGLVADSHLTFDMRWHYRSSRGKAVVGIENLFNEAYRDIPQAIEHGRRAFLSVGLEF